MAQIFKQDHGGLFQSIYDKVYDILHPAKFIWVFCNFQRAKRENVPGGTANLKHLFRLVLGTWRYQAVSQI